MNLKVDLLNKEKWQEFRLDRISKDYISDKEKEAINNYVMNEKYMDIASSFINGDYTFSNPKKIIINKIKTSKKRIVYNLNNDEMIFLKYVTYLLYDYDYLFINNLYSFRKSIGVKRAIINLSNIKNLNNMYGYKADIHDYFNSINLDILFDNLKKDINDKLLLKLFEDILLNDFVIYGDEIIKESHKGVMAGIPISAFLANYYLISLDQMFKDKKLLYLRYADDIIIFANTEEEILKYRLELLKEIEIKKLIINEEKELFIEPNTKFNFLGFSIYNKVIDLSDNTILKIKAKIKRSAKGIRRWMLKNKVEPDKAIKAMNRKFNRKFYGNDLNDELSWKYWFFPTINTSHSLKIIDKYMQDELRFLYTGYHNKRNYKIVPYEKLKTLNYRSLVNEFYK